MLNETGKSKIAFFMKYSWKVVLGLVALYMLYIPYGMWSSNNINVMTDMTVEVQPKQSHAVGMVIRLMETQLETDWVSNNPSWQPSSWLDNTPNFQKGISKVAAQFGYAMAHFAGRTRSSSSMDTDLDNAMGRLNYAPNVWVYEPSVSTYGFAATTESQYSKALEFFMKYQNNLVTDKAVFDVRADSLLAILKMFSNNMGSLAANVEKHVADNPNGIFDTEIDDKFYFNKGQTYAYYMILRELGKDYEEVINEKKQAQIWNQMLHSLKIVAEIEPLVVFGGDLDTMFLNNHLVGQGFHLLLADRRMKEVIDGLLK